MSRNLSAQASRLIKKEKASRPGRHKHSPTALDKAAEEWVTEQELRKRKQREKERKEREAETALKSVSLEEYKKSHSRLDTRGLNGLPINRKKMKPMQRRRKFPSMP